MAANREESLEKISTRGGVRPAEVVSGDMMALRPVGATIGPADLARRAAPRYECFGECIGIFIVTEMGGLLAATASVV